MPIRYLSIMARFHALLRTLALGFALLLAAIAPARAAVTLTFWSQEFGQNFPHAFVTLRGTPDAGGEPVDTNFGFTAKAISPAILWGSVPGEVSDLTRSYMKISNVHFSVVLSDAQYAAVLSLAREWDEGTGDSTYNLNRRNCVHFVAEAARRAGLVVVVEKKLMKKPRSFTQSIAALNAGKITVIEQPAETYWATLAPIGQAAPAAVAQ
jgi:hypothetical protein